MTAYLATVPEVKDVQLYAGNAAPFNFNGLVRHYFLRRSPHVGRPAGEPRRQGRARRAEPRHRQARAPGPRRDREAARRAGQGGRDPARAARHGHDGGRDLRPDAAGRGRTWRRPVRGLFETTAGVVDVHDSMEAERDRVLVSLDREKAGLKGIPAAAAVETLAGPGAGRDVARIDAPVLARAGAGARPPLGGRPGEPRAAPLAARRLARWAARSRSASWRASSRRPSRSPSCART